MFKIPHTVLIANDYTIIHSFIEENHFSFIEYHLEADTTVISHSYW